MEHPQPDDVSSSTSPSMVVDINTVDSLPQSRFVSEDGPAEHPHPDDVSSRTSPSMVVDINTADGLPQSRFVSRGLLSLEYNRRNRSKNKRARTSSASGAVNQTDENSNSTALSQGKTTDVSIQQPLPTAAAPQGQGFSEKKLEKNYTDIRKTLPIS